MADGCCRLFIHMSSLWMNDAAVWAALLWNSNSWHGDKIFRSLSWGESETFRAHTAASFIHSDLGMGELQVPSSIAMALMSTLVVCWQFLQLKKSNPVLGVWAVSCRACLQKPDIAPLVHWSRVRWFAGSWGAKIVNANFFVSAKICVFVFLPKL